MSSKHDRERPGSAGEDAAVTRAWQQASDEQPPARLDAEILAAARRSVEAKDPAAPSLPVRPWTRSRWRQWQPLAAAATVAGLAFVLVQTIPREREVAPPIRIEVPAPAPSPEREVAPPVRGDAPTVAPGPEVTLESRSSAPAPVVTHAPVVPDSGPTGREGSVAGAARSPAAEAAADVADKMRNAETDHRKGVMTEASGDAYSAETAAPAAARAPSAAARPRAADWAARIEALHASGDLAAAATALREFRAADPDADTRLPESLQEWARTVQ